MRQASPQESVAQTDERLSRARKTLDYCISWFSLQLACHGPGASQLFIIAIGTTVLRWTLAASAVLHVAQNRGAEQAMRKYSVNSITQIRPFVSIFNVAMAPIFLYAVFDWLFWVPKAGSDYSLVARYAMHTPHIGILAGMGPRSTAPFTDLLITECQRQYGAHYDIDFLPMLIYSLPTPYLS